MSDSQTFAYEVPGGCLWVEVLAAHRDIYLDGQGRRYTWFEPRVRVSTYPQGSYADRRFVQLRSHRYSIDTVYAIRRIHGLMECGRTYSRGLRHESGNEVPLSSAARPRLRALAARVLDDFFDDRPDWQAVSRRLLAVDELSAAQGRVEGLRRDLAAAQAAVAQLRADLATLDTQQDSNALTMVR